MIWFTAAIAAYMVCTIFAARWWYANYRWETAAHLELTAGVKALLSLLVGFFWPIAAPAVLVVLNNSTQHEREKAIKERELNIMRLERRLLDNNNS